jgi:DNA (cytosine-5)-methyltransferase 1
VATVAEQWQTPAKDQFSKRRQVGQTEREELLLPAQAEQWATPTSRDHKDGACDLEKNPVNGLLGRQVLQTAKLGSESSPPTRRLNPRFVEWLMGLPLGWTDFEPLEMESFLSRQRSRLEHLLRS